MSTEAEPAPERPAPAPAGDGRTTRERMVRAAIEIVAAEGAAALTTVEVCRRVGIAQSSYYTHFATRDDLLAALAEVVAVNSNVPNRRAREIFAATRDADSHREMFRVPVEMIGRSPELFRLARSARAAPPDTALGAQSRRAEAASRRQVADHLMALGGVEGDRFRRRHEMAADCVNAMVATLAEGHVDGRYPDLEEVVDLLVLLTGWGRATSGWLTTPSGPDGTSTDPRVD